MSIAKTLLTATRQNNTEQALACFDDYIPSRAYTQATDEEGRNAFMWAVINQNKTLVSAFIEAGASHNHVDNKGRTIAYYAAAGQNTEILALVISCGADMACATPHLNGMKVIASSRNPKKIQTAFDILKHEFSSREICRQMGHTITLVCTNKRGDLRFIKQRQKGRS
ncbi:MAG: ankyrin repeat domain-containing protein [Alphaproteobacteria bacterium]|nr:ankyrin repeat domain-containing protein [Alphaproteobacteria bacterium]